MARKGQKPLALAFTGEQPLTKEERALLEEAYGRLEIFLRGCREIHDRAKESRKIYQLQDPNQDLPGTARERAALQLQTLKSTINNCVADQMDNMPEAVMLPERPGLEKTAEDMTDVMRFILAQNNFEAVQRRRVEDFFITGTAVTQVAWDRDMDEGEGNVAVLRWPVESFLWDPAAESLQDSRAVIKVSWHPMSWFREHYPDKAGYIRGETAEFSSVGRPESQDRLDQTDEDRAMLMEYWFREYDPEKRGYRVSVAYFAGGALLEAARNVYRHGRYPFILDAYSPIEGLPVGDGMVQELAPMMRYVNRYAHYVDENLRMASKNRALVRRNANIDIAALCDWQKNLIEGDDISPEAVQWFQSKPLNGMAVQQMLQFQTDIKQDSGQNQFTRGETAGGVTAASAISALQEAGGKITRLRTNVLNQGFQEIVEQAMWLVSQFYGGKKTRLITGRMGNQREVDLSAGHLMGGEGAQSRLPAPPYHVQIQISRRNPLRVQAQNELFIQAYTMAAQAGQQFPLTMLFELLQVDGKDRIMPVLYQVEQQNQLLLEAQQAVQENEQMKIQMMDMHRMLAGNGQELRADMLSQAGGAGQALGAGQVEGAGVYGGSLDDAGAGATGVPQTPPSP